MDDVSLEAVVLGELARRAAACDLPFLVVGATARDLLIRNSDSAVPLRRTHDVDIAVAVVDWPDLDRLTAGLTHVDGRTHTYDVRGVPVDIVPFRGVEAPDRTIRWPDDHVMNVAGLDEALQTAVAVELVGGVRVHVASLPAQVVLKLFAWSDRHHRDPRDAIDLKSIFGAYSLGSHLDALYETFDASLVRQDFDVPLATADRVGVEIQKILDHTTLDALQALIGQQLGEESTLVADMGFDVSRNRELLAALSAGLATH